MLNNVRWAVSLKYKNKTKKPSLTLMTDDGFCDVIKENVAASLLIMSFLYYIIDNFSQYVKTFCITVRKWCRNKWMLAGELTWLADVIPAVSKKVIKSKKTCWSNEYGFFSESCSRF